MNLKHIYWRLESKFYKVCGELLRWLPVQPQKIVLNNFHGKGFGDSPKYLAEEIIRQKLPYDLVWLVDDLNTPMPSAIRKVKLHSILATYELSTAKMIISNVKVALPYHKKLNQIYIQTWHGSVAFKAIEADAQDKLRPDYVRESQADSKLINIFLSSNSIQTHEINTCFWYDGEILESGSPRNDILFANKNVLQNIKRKMGLPEGKKFVLYAPTFRDSHRTDVFNLDLKKLKKNLDTNTGEDWYVLTRLHPNIQKEMHFNNDSFLLDMTFYPDMQEILLVADALVTDYSTIIYDMAIMHKPVFLYAPDLDEYKDDRGLKAIYFDFPTHICKSNEELSEYLLKFNLGIYKKELDDFLQSIQVFDDGNASKRVVERISRDIN